MKQILFFGDSLTAGYGLRNADKESFPALIKTCLVTEGIVNYEVTNAGVSGDTSADGLKRIKHLLNRQIDVFVLALGANDLLRGIEPTVTYTHLSAIVSLVIAEHPNVKLLLLGMELPVWLPGKRIAEFREIFRKLADRYQMEFVPFLLAGVGGVRHLNMADGVHPLAEGYQIVAKNVWPALRKLL
jgi:acyl-CoA thioesterase-1